MYLWGFSDERGSITRYHCVPGYNSTFSVSWNGLILSYWSNARNEKESCFLRWRTNRMAREGTRHTRIEWIIFIACVFRLCSGATLALTKHSIKLSRPISSVVDLLIAYIPSSTVSYISRRLYDAKHSSVRGVLWGITKVQYFVASGTQLAPQFGILALLIFAKGGCIHIKKWTT
jgi:hypothetical protein